MALTIFRLNGRHYVGNDYWIPLSAGDFEQAKFIIEYNEFANSHKQMSYVLSEEELEQKKRAICCEEGCNYELLKLDISQLASEKKEQLRALIFTDLISESFSMSMQRSEENAPFMLPRNSEELIAYLQNSENGFASYIQPTSVFPEYFPCLLDTFSFFSNSLRAITTEAGAMYDEMRAYVNNRRG